MIHFPVIDLTVNEDKQFAAIFILSVSKSENKTVLLTFLDNLTKELIEIVDPPFNDVKFTIYLDENNEYNNNSIENVENTIPIYIVILNSHPVDSVEYENLNELVAVRTITVIKNMLKLDNRENKNVSVIDVEIDTEH